MIYLAGIFGFIGGFFLGLMILHFLLRHKTREELFHDQSLKWKSGLFCWAVAALSSYSFVQLYKVYF